MTNIAQRLAETTKMLEEFRQTAPLAAGAPQLIAVSKRQSKSAIQAALDAGHRQFGENKLQEGVEHWREHRAHYPDLTLHYIGGLQSNKAEEVVQFFDVIHSLDRPKLAKALAAAMHTHNKRPECFIQINTGEEPQKSGILPKEADAFIVACKEEYQLPITGLMCIPPADENPSAHFAFLRELAQRHNLPHLSMGMSADWQTALRLGATHIRLGTALFGERDG